MRSPGERRAPGRPRLRGGLAIALMLLAVSFAPVPSQARARELVRRDPPSPPAPKLPPAPTPAPGPGLIITVQVAPGTAIAYRNSLEQNAPNPAVAGTAIHYSCARAARVTIRLFSVQGQRVATLVDRWHDPGLYSVWWDGRGDNGRTLAQGVYVYRMETQGFSKSLKMVIKE